jgi:hypothetical protein
LSHGLLACLHKTAFLEELSFQWNLRNGKQETSCKK